MYNAAAIVRAGAQTTRYTDSRVWFKSVAHALPNDTKAEALAVSYLSPTFGFRREFRCPPPDYEYEYDTDKMEEVKTLLPARPVPQDLQDVIATLYAADTLIGVLPSVVLDLVGQYLVDITTCTNAELESVQTLFHCSSPYDVPRLLKRMSPEIRQSKHVTMIAIARAYYAFTYFTTDNFPVLHVVHNKQYMRELLWHGPHLFQPDLNCPGELLDCVRQLQDDTEIAYTLFDGVLTKAQYGFCPENNPELIFQHLSPRLRGDKPFVLFALRICGNCLPYVTEPLRYDREVVRTAVTADIGDECRIFQRALKYAGPFQDDEEVVHLAIDAYGAHIVRTDSYMDSYMAGSELMPLRFASPRLRDDFETVKRAVTLVGDSLQFASARLQDDRDIVHAAVTADGRALRYASRRLRKRYSIILAALYQTGDAFKFLPEARQADPVLVQIAASKNIHMLQYVPVALRQDKHLMSFCTRVPQPFSPGRAYAIACNAEYWARRVQCALGYASPELQNDRAFVLAAVAINGPALCYASEALRKDVEVATVAIYQDPSAIFAVDARLRRHNKTLALAALRHPAMTYEVAKKIMLDWFYDKEVLLQVFNQAYVRHKDSSLYDLCGEDLHDVHPSLKHLKSLQHDPDVAYASVVNSCIGNLHYAGTTLTNDQAFMQRIVDAFPNGFRGDNGCIVPYLGPQLFNDRAFVWKILQLCNKPRVEKLALDTTLLDDRDFLLQVLRLNPLHVYNDLKDTQVYDVINRDAEMMAVVNQARTNATV